MDCTWKGPYIVKEIVGKGRYQLESSSGKVLKKLYNGALLKEYYSTTDVVDLESGATELVEQDDTENWVSHLGLSCTEKVTLESGAMLTDKHMHAAHKLLRKQFTHIQGCQSTLLVQSHGFTAVSDEGMHMHKYIQEIHSVYCYYCIIY